MVRAILAGQKSQTRRIMKPQPSSDFLPEVGRYHPTLIDRRSGESFPGPECFGASDESEDYPCPYGHPGDRLWVRETWRTLKAWDCIMPAYLKSCDDPAPVMYVADCYCDPIQVDPESWGRTRSPLHLPRWASRLTLEITAVRVERLQDISEADANAEGCPLSSADQHWSQCRVWYQQLWESINGPGSWEANPWVWVIEFKQLIHI